MIDEQPYILVSYQAKIILPMCEYLPTPVPAFSRHVGPDPPTGAPLFNDVMV